MTDHYIEEDGVRHVTHIAHTDGVMRAYWVRINGELVRCEEDQE